MATGREKMKVFASFINRRKSAGAIVATSAVLLGGTPALAQVCEASNLDPMPPVKAHLTIIGTYEEGDKQAEAINEARIAFNSAVKDMENAETTEEFEHAFAKAKSALNAHFGLLEQRARNSSEDSRERGNLGKSVSAVKADYERSLASLEIAAEAKAASLNNG